MDVHYQLIFVTRLLKWLQWVFVLVLFRDSFVSRMAVSPRFYAGKEISHPILNLFSLL